MMLRLASRGKKCTDQMPFPEGVTEQLKARDQLGWVQAVNSCTARAVEIVVRETVLA